MFGGRLTALRYPEKELVSVPAERVWYEPAQPLPDARPGDVPGRYGRRRCRGPPAIPTCSTSPTCSGKRVVETGYHGRVTVREENAAGALEVMSRFAVDPRWLLYLPPDHGPVPPPPAGRTCWSTRPRRSRPTRPTASPR